MTCMPVQKIIHAQRVQNTKSEAHLEPKLWGGGARLPLLWVILALLSSTPRTGPSFQRCHTGPEYHCCETASSPPRTTNCRGSRSRVRVAREALARVRVARARAVLVRA